MLDGEHFAEIGEHHFLLGDETRETDGMYPLPFHVGPPSSLDQFRNPMSHVVTSSRATSSTVVAVIRLTGT